jgi:hypothetical protein
MNWFVIENWTLLLLLEGVMRFRGLKKLHDLVRRQRVQPVPISRVPSPEELCRASDLACVFYFKQVLCLQRSAAAALLLKRYGYDAKLVIGAQVLPFKSHAWVEIEERVMNDKPYMPDIYMVLERI